MQAVISQRQLRLVCADVPTFLKALRRSSTDCRSYLDDELERCG